MSSPVPVFPSSPQARTGLGYGVVSWCRGVCAFISLLYIFTCSHAAAAEYRLSMLPLFATEEIYRRIKPLAEYLSKETGIRIEPVVTADFSQYSQQLASGGIHIGYQNPYVYVTHSTVHEVIAKASSGEYGNRFRGIIITRADSSIRSIQQLRGKKIAVVDRTSVGGYLSQAITLQQSGFDMSKDFIIEDAVENKHENVIFSVFAGDVDAGFIRESAFAKVSDFVPPGTIRTLTATAWMPNWALSISRSMPDGDRKKIISAIERLQAGSPALKAMQINTLELCADGEFDVVREAVGLTPTKHRAK